jgi:hypothetical protein
MRARVTKPARKRNYEVKTMTELMQRPRPRFNARPFGCLHPGSFSWTLLIGISLDIGHWSLVIFGYRFAALHSSVKPAPPAHATPQSVPQNFWCYLVLFGAIWRCLVLKNILLMFPQFLKMSKMQPWPPQPPPKLVLKTYELPFAT